VSLLNTAQKIGLAKIASRSVLACRKLFGKPSEAQFTRHGIRWRLDLREGIDFSIFLLGAFEPSTVRTYRALVKPGQTVLDIGANIGAHTLLLAQLVGANGRVIAFEPTAFAYQKCAANVALNPSLQSCISLHQVMLVETEDEALPSAVFSSWPLVEVPALHEKHRGQLMETKGARARTLDQIVSELELSAVHFIKLDVDGFEYPVLSGGRQTLRKFRPPILLELAPYVHAEHGHTLEELVALLRETGYELRDMATLRPIYADPASLRKQIPDGGSINVLAISADGASR
jgi:FkbM family methyltransferase